MFYEFAFRTPYPQQMCNLFTEESTGLDFMY
jgi:hypothetical protein